MREVRHRKGNMPVLSPVKMEKVGLTEVGSAGTVAVDWRDSGPGRSELGAFSTDGWAE